MSSRIVVVGASLGGLRAAEQLRAGGHRGPITLVGEEPHPPYSRPPLSKELLAEPGDTEPARLVESVAFRRRASVADLEFLLGRRAVASDLVHQTVTLEGGMQLSYDGLVIATGLRARRVDVPGPLEGRYTLRTLDDAIALRRALDGRRRVVVLGAGFVGCETACTLTKLGLHVTVVEPFGRPMERVLGAEVAACLQRHLEASGVSFQLGTTVAELMGDDVVTGVRLSDGRELPADLVLESVGSICNTEWLGCNPGVDLTDGILCDNDLAVAGVDRVVAVGDVARFPNPLFDEIPRRVEHWSMPTDAAKRAAPTLLAAVGEMEPVTGPFAPIPSFWSDQLDLRLQSFGAPGLADRAAVIEGSLAQPAEGLLVTYHRAERHVGTLAVNLSPARQRELREAFVPLVPTA